MRLYTKHRRAIIGFPLFLLFYFVIRGNTEGTFRGMQIQMAPSHTALSGDFHIHIVSSSFPPLLLQLSRLEGETVQTLTTFPVLPEASALNANLTTIKISCGYFSKGGQYYILIKKQKSDRSSNEPEDITNMDQNDDVIARTLDVRWPMPQLSLTPEHVQTYPESPVTAILEFPEVVCPPMADSLAKAIPEFWLELQYCGHSLLTCDNNVVTGNQSNPQVLYSEQVRGFPGKRMITLQCEFFGLAGHYALFLKPTTQGPLLPHTSAYVKADWSEQFVFNVHASSIFPCDVHSGGIIVLFQYPACILTAGDRVRVFARLRANVASLAPPTTLEYVAEQRVVRGKNRMEFDCELFSERYVEYCFVYVSQAITGAVADVRMDCVPTLPVQDSESGGWGPWSPWTHCSSTCFGGTRSRYRFCDSPAPRYGAKFCEGPAVETEKCGIGIGKSWECFYGNRLSVGDIVAEIPEVKAEIGPYCRCGCVVHLGKAKPRRLLATSSQSCPGRIFWQIQADRNHYIQFKVEQFHLPCGIQWLKVRDGPALSSKLLADLSGLPEDHPSIINSTGSNLLLEFFSEENFGPGPQKCGGGFLAYATQLKTPNVTILPVAQSVSVLPATVLKLSSIHIATIFFLSGLVLATILMAIQYVFRYRKYHIALAEDQESLTEMSNYDGNIPLKERISSNATLLSEVISLTRLRPNINSRSKHSRLRESTDCEQESTTDCTEATLAKEESSSMSSTVTLTNVDNMEARHKNHKSDGDVTSPNESTSSSVLSDQKSNEKSLERNQFNNLNSFKNYLRQNPHLVRRISNLSSPTLTKGCYSSSQSMISTATIKSTNIKESKDKKNRERLLAGPSGSDFSIVGPEVDLEIDYYDYNVSNAGAAPGSYLGMDPAFLVWIPPLDESGEILPEDDIEKHEMKNIKVYVNPDGINPHENEFLIPKSNEISSPSKNKIIYVLNEKSDNKKQEEICIQLYEFANKNLVSHADEENDKEIDRKSHIVDSNILDEIRFADEDDDKDLNETECNINLSYQNPKILSSKKD